MLFGTKLFILGFLPIAVGGFFAPAGSAAARHCAGS